MRHRFLFALVLSATFSGVVPLSASASPAVYIPPGWPQRLIIPRLGVNASVEDLSLTKPSDVHAPYRWGDVGWYDLGAKPGDLGRAAIFGHVDSTCCPAVFYHLRDLHKGDTFRVTYKRGKPLTFRVLWSANYADNKLPDRFIFGPARERGVSLITCSGVFHRDGTGYDHKLVVYARLVLPNGKLG